MQRQESHLLIHYPSGGNSLVWAKVKPGVCNSIGVSCGWQGLKHLGYLLLPPKYIFRELNLEMEQLRLEPGLMCYAGITRGSLTYCHDSLLYLLF